MASRTSRKEWVRGLPSAFGVGRYDRKRVHSASERSVGYVFLIRESVRNHPNLHPYQTGSKKYSYYGCISNRSERRSSTASEGGKPPHRISNIPADWLEGLVWADVRAFLKDPGEIVERLRSEEIDTDAASNELKVRLDDLTKRLAAKNAEKDRYIRAYAQGHISEEELAEYVADIKNQTNNLRLLISSVEDDLASLTETREVAESAAEWLLILRERTSEVEDDTPEAFRKRRELVRLLVERLTTDRDENSHRRVEITYRFGPPPEESFVPSVLNSGPREAEKTLRSALFPPSLGKRKFGWA